MKAITRKSIAVLCVLVLVVGSVWGVTSIFNPAKEVSAKVSAKTAEKLLSEQTKSKLDDNELSKSETVYVNLGVDGNAKDVTVSDVLNVVGNNPIDDFSRLKDIKNVSGNEKFTVKDGGNIQWENKGKNITYQGKTDEELPITFDIEYTLDGKKMSAKEIEGKSGHVAIAYNMKNNTGVENYTPIVILGAIFLDDSKFDDVSISKGKVTEYGSNIITIGFAVPGLKEYLNQNINNKSEYLDKLEVDDGFVIEGDVKDFSLGMGMFIGTSNLVDFNIKDAIDLSDIKDKVNQLEDGAKQLVDGSSKLSSGAKQLKDGSGEIYLGVKKLAKYTGDLSDGTSKLKTNYKVFNSKLIKGSKDLNTGAKKIKNATKQIYDGTSDIKKGSSDLDDGMTSLKSGTGQVSEGVATVKNGLEKDGGIIDGAGQLKAGAKSANSGVKELAGTLEGVPQSLQNQIDGIIAQVKAASGGAIASYEALKTTVNGINNAVKAGTPLETVLQAQNLDAATYYSLVQAFYSIETLNSVKSTIETQIEQKATDIAKLLDGMEALEKGSSDLYDGIKQLDAGVGQLDVGAQTVDQGATKIKSGTTALSSGATKLNKGAKDTKDGADTLYGGTSKLYKQLKKLSPQVLSGITKLDNGASQIAVGTVKLKKGAGALDSGMLTLADGTDTLKDGVVKLNEEGISKITALAGVKLDNAIDVIQDMLNAGNKYKSFGGIKKGMSGNVKFIFKTTEIGEEE